MIQRLLDATERHWSTKWLHLGSRYERFRVWAQKRVGYLIYRGLRWANRVGFGDIYVTRHAQHRHAQRSNRPLHTAIADMMVGRYMPVVEHSNGTKGMYLYRDGLVALFEENDGLRYVTTFKRIDDDELDDPMSAFRVVEAH